MEIPYLLSSESFKSLEVIFQVGTFVKRNGFYNHISRMQGSDEVLDELHKTSRFLNFQTFFSYGKNERFSQRLIIRILFKFTHNTGWNQEKYEKLSLYEMILNK